MPNLIPFECWKELRAAGVEAAVVADQIHQYNTPLNTNPPFELVELYHGKFERLIKIFDDIRGTKDTDDRTVIQGGSEILGKFLEHDFGTFLQKLRFSLDLCIRSKGSPKSLQRLKKNNYAMRVINNAIGSVRYYVDGCLEVADVSLTGFLFHHGEIIRNSFDPQSQGKITEFRIIDDVTVKMDPSTLGNLCQNVPRNSHDHGKANLLRVEAYLKDKKAKLRFLDDGRGIDRSRGENSKDGIIDDIYDRHRSGHGRGLGLADARNRLQAFGADIKCHGHGGIYNRISRVRGALFEVTLEISDI